MTRSWSQNFKRAPKQDRTYDGIVFDSALEMRVWQSLVIMERAGEVKNVVRQKKHLLVLPNGTPIKTPTGLTRSYKPDMEYDRISDGKHMVIEVKGFLDPLSEFRIAVFEAVTGHTVTFVRK